MSLRMLHDCDLALLFDFFRYTLEIVIEGTGILVQGFTLSPLECIIPRSLGQDYYS